MSERAASPSSVRTRPPRSLTVVRDPAPEEVGARIDWSRWYLTEEDDVGWGTEQFDAARVLVDALELLARERGWNAYVGSDQFVAWVPDEPLVRVSPDAYVVHDPPDPLPSSWQVWKPGHRPPDFAVELVSDETWRKDYDDNPEKYAQIGVRELVVFDPEALARPKRSTATGLGKPLPIERVPLQLWRREADGSFVRSFAGAGPVRSEILDAWLVGKLEHGRGFVRIARDALGEHLLPTAAERDADRARADADRARAETDRARADAERRRVESERDVERAARERAEAELAALRASLAKRGP